MQSALYLPRILKQISISAMIPQWVAVFLFGFCPPKSIGNNSLENAAHAVILHVPRNNLVDPNKNLMEKENLGSVFEKKNKFYLESPQ